MTSRQLAVASILALTAAVAYGEAIPRELYKDGKAPKAERVIPATLEGGHKVTKAEHCSSRTCRPWKEGDALVITCASGQVIISTPAGLDKAAERCKS